MSRTDVHRHAARLLLLAIGILGAVLVYVLSVSGDFGLGVLGFVPALVISVSLVTAFMHRFPPGPIGILVAIPLAMAIWIAYIWVALVSSGPWD